jgi:molecular chaperone IbpA
MPEDLFNRIFRSSIGFDPLQQFVTTVDFSNYPPYNITKTQDANIYALTMAIAGFAREEVDVFIEDEILHINGVKEHDETEDQLYFLHRGLSFRDFKRTFQLDKHIEVSSVSLNNGLLTIVMQENVPESARKKFNID